jgi:hypothetical protein
VTVAAIQASGLVKTFGTTGAVDGLDMTVPQGGVFGLLGPNGARVRATDATARRAFAACWLLIRAGGAGFIRLEMLRAIARRAEQPKHARSPARPPSRCRKQALRAIHVSGPTSVAERHRSWSWGQLA